MPAGARMTPARPSWTRSPRFWIAAVAGGALVLAVACGIEAIRVEPIRLGFGICAVTFLLAAAGCAVAALQEGHAEMTAAEPFSQVELQLAARNHGMPLEALRYPVTPTGLHYLLTHYDIPAVDPASFGLSVGGRVARPLALSLDDLRAATGRRARGDDGVRRQRPRPLLARAR